MCAFQGTPGFFCFGVGQNSSDPLLAQSTTAPNPIHRQIVARGSAQIIVARSRPFRRPVSQEQAPRFAKDTDEAALINFAFSPPAEQLDSMTFTLTGYRVCSVDLEADELQVERFSYSKRRFAQWECLTGMKSKENLIRSKAE